MHEDLREPPPKKPPTRNLDRQTEHGVDDGIPRTCLMLAVCTGQAAFVLTAGSKKQKDRGEATMQGGASQVEYLCSSPFRVR